VAVSSAMILTTSVVIGNVDVVAADELCRTDLGDSTPVVLVHGLNSNIGVWDSMMSSLAEIDDLKPVKFDYQAVNNEWVTHEDIGPKLARYIDCLAQVSLEGGGKGKVIVLAHSMGGLATRYAVNETVDDRLVADEVGLVITIGTPHWGSDMAKLCESLGLMPQCRGSAPLALRPDSSELANLPEFPDSIPVRAIAGDVTLRDQLFETEFALDLNSDVVVKVDSATAFSSDTTVGDGESVFECDGKYTRFLGFITGIEAACEHTTMLSTDYIQEDVIVSIEEYLVSQSVEMTNLHGLELPLDESWELSYQTVHNPSGAYSNVVRTDLCDREPEMNDYCPSFKVIDVAAFNGLFFWDYPGTDEDCLSYGLYDDLWHTPPQSTEEVTIGGKQATHRTHWQCRAYVGASALPPSSAASASDIMHSWEVDGLVVVEHNFDSNDPLVGLEDLLARAEWS